MRYYKLSFYTSFSPQRTKYSDFYQLQMYTLRIEYA